jgi:hypothetical protein
LIPESKEGSEGAGGTDGEDSKTEDFTSYINASYINVCLFNNFDRFLTEKMVRKLSLLLRHLSSQQWKNSGI